MSRLKEGLYNLYYSNISDSNINNNEIGEECSMHGKD
jgi:hypothetical protein